MRGRSGVARSSVPGRVHRHSPLCIALCNQHRRLRAFSANLRHLLLPLTEHRTCADRGLPIHGTCRNPTSLPPVLGGRTLKIAALLRYSPEKIRHNSLALGLTALIPFFSGLSLRAPRAGCIGFRFESRLASREYWQRSSTWPRLAPGRSAPAGEQVARVEDGKIPA
jgi:hypothetical protein